MLRSGGSALDAVQAAVLVLEDDPLFNAGTGSCLNAEGEVEADAALMSGERLSAGAVAAVRALKNPILLARGVMEQTEHVLLCGEGALRLARKLGLPQCDPSELVTERARARYQRELSERQGREHGTVGAVAVDQRGHLAAGTSTGGTRFKLPGRIGDTPLIGCGTYADDLAGAVSCTGHGEAIIKVVLARFACDRLRQGQPPAEAVQQALRQLERVGGEGGLILVDAQGRLGWGCNTERMSHAFVDGEGREGSGFERDGRRLA